MTLLRLSLPRFPRLSAQDLGFVTQILLWQLAFRALKHVVPLATLVRLARIGPRRSSRDCPREFRFAQLLDRVNSLLPLRFECLERSLLLYRFLSGVNAKPRLVVGVDRAADHVQGHVWVVVDGYPVGESEAWVAKFHTAAVFGENGLVLP